MVERLLGESLAGDSVVHRSRAMGLEEMLQMWREGLRGFR